MGLTSAMASVGDCAMERRGVGERQRAPRRFAEEGLVFPRPPRGRGGEENRPMGGGGRARTHVLSFTAWRWLSCARRIRGTTQSRSPGRSRGVRTGAGGLSGARAGVGGGGAVAQLFDGWRRSAVRSAGRYEYDRQLLLPLVLVAHHHQHHSSSPPTGRDVPAMGPKRRRPGAPAPAPRPAPTVPNTTTAPCLIPPPFPPGAPPPDGFTADARSFAPEVRRVSPRRARIPSRGPRAGTGVDLGPDPRGSRTGRRLVRRLRVGRDPDAPSSDHDVPPRTRWATSR